MPSTDACTEMSIPSAPPISTNPCVFAVGCPRSGTTLLRRILDSHGELAVPKTETHWIPKLAKSPFVSREGEVTGSLREALGANERFRKLGLPETFLREAFARSDALAYPELVREVFDAYARQQGKRLAGDKTPGYARCIPTLHRLFPEARFIHLVRDGRDVALSLRAWKRLPKTVAKLDSFAEDEWMTLALFWEWMTRLAMEAGESLPPGHYLEVRYERLLADLPEQTRRICAFLGLAWDSNMLTFFEGKQRSGADLSAKKSWLPPTQGLRDWRSQMAPDALENFEAVAGSLLESLGYELGVPDSRPGLIERAEELRARFSRRPLPDAWT